MPDNSLIFPAAFTTGDYIDQRTNDARQRQPQKLPCTVTEIDGEFVTVNFEVQSGFSLPKLKIPKAQHSSVREATQVGDKGWAVSSDYYLGGQSDDGGGTANLYPRGNMTTLVFQAASTKDATPRDVNAALINGPNGVVLKDTGGACIFTLTPSGIQASVGGASFSLTSAGLSVTVGGLTTLIDGTGVHVGNNTLISTTGITTQGGVMSLANGTFTTTAGGQTTTIGPSGVSTTAEVTAKAGAGQVILSQHVHPTPSGVSSPPTPGT
jgi:hypothetical protein